MRLVLTLKVWCTVNLILWNLEKVFLKCDIIHVLSVFPFEFWPLLLWNLHLLSFTLYSGTWMRHLHLLTPFSQPLFHWTFLCHFVFTKAVLAKGQNNLWLANPLISACNAVYLYFLWLLGYASPVGMYVSMCVCLFLLLIWPFTIFSAMSLPFLPFLKSLGPLIGSSFSSLSILSPSAFSTTSVAVSTIYVGIASKMVSLA